MTDAELVISVLVSIKVFAACANFRPLCFVPQSRDFWSAHASPRRFLREKAVDRKAMRRRLALPTPKAFARPHLPHTGGQAVQDAMDAFRPIHIRVISEPSCGNSETEGKA